MCEVVTRPPVSYGDVCRSQSSKPSPHKIQVQKLLAKLPTLGEEYDLDCKVGEGSFSSVYLGRSKIDPKQRVAIKHHNPTCHPARIARELKCMHHLGGEDNIVEVISCFRMHDCVVFVMPYQPHDKFSSYVGELSVRELQIYLKGLLIALRRVHSHGIIHRDVKPSNFLFHRKTQRFLLVDFGLAQNVEECTSGENGENFTSIKIELRKTEETSLDRKRKRDSTEASPEIAPSVKRLALQPISNNISTLHRGHRLNCKSSHLSKTSEATSIVPAHTVHPKSDSVMTKSSYLLSRHKAATQQTALVVKRNPFSQSFSNISPVTSSKNSFVRIQNSQVKVVGGLFAKPLPPSSSQVVCTPSSSSPLSSLGKRCHCDGRARFCNMCLTRRARVAPRAGTPGFRPPEVLLKYPNQTTAVDMWAVGVIMLSIMSSTYPFFRSPDDITALAELITIFGTEQIKALAKKLGRNIICSENRGALDLRKLCEAFRRRRCGEENSNVTLLTTECRQCKMSVGEECLCPSSEHRIPDPRFPDVAYQLLYRFLEIDPEKRITAEDALEHPFFSFKL